MELIKQEKLISHSVSPETLERKNKKIADHIRHQGDKLYTTVQHQLELLAQLNEFDLGRYLLQNQGIK